MVGLVLMTSVNGAQYGAYYGDKGEGRSTNGGPTTNDVLDGKYSYNNLWNLFVQDVLRWVNITEDILAETLQRQFFEGIVDKKTIKLGMRFFAQKIYNTLNDQGMISEEFKNIQFL